jgi:hypothetical protein
MKSSNTCDLMVLHDAYVIFCPINSRAHLAILPSASAFYITSPSEYFYTTVMRYASSNAGAAA